MTERESFKLYEMKKHIAAREQYKCFICGKPTPLGFGQLAHRIGQGKVNIKKYGKKVIHHPKNLRWVDSLRCNQKVSIDSRPLEVLELVERIREDK
ncbi:MAG: hypothetical protein DRN81_03110 [Thermoproteota archaeon]|nr:MAG: hypothetical protein DRN81_03110 [Candidatus Korarchaeota archaeon]